MTKPLLDKVSSGVVAVVTEGGSAIGLTVNTNVSLEVSVVPFSVPATDTVMVAAPNLSARRDGQRPARSGAA